MSSRDSSRSHRGFAPSLPLDHQLRLEPRASRSHPGSPGETRIASEPSLGRFKEEMRWGAFQSRPLGGAKAAILSERVDGEVW